VKRENIIPYTSRKEYTYSRFKSYEKRNNLLWIILLLSFSVFINCSEESPTENSYRQYNGTWLWLRTVGGTAPRVFTPPEGVTIKISYNELGIFRKLRNDSIKVMANYSIEVSQYDRDKISYSNITTYDFHFDSSSEYAQLRTDTLEIWDGVIDGYFSFYKKIH